MTDFLRDLLARPGAAVVSAYGAAGSLIVLLMWIYFSSAVLLLGASCARAVEEHVAKQNGELQPPGTPKVERRKSERRTRKGVPAH